MCRVFLPLSTGAKSIKIDQQVTKARVIIKNKVAHFYGSLCISHNANVLTTQE